MDRGWRGLLQKLKLWGQKWRLQRTQDKRTTGSRLTPAREGEERTRDSVDLILPPLRLKVCRRSRLDVPHELTVVVPRAELRETWTIEKGKMTRHREIIFNSITVVSAPRHPLAGEGSQLADSRSSRGED